MMTKMKQKNDVSEKKQLVKNSVIVISNDMKHDAFAVKEFEKEAHFYGCYNTVTVTFYYLDR